MIHSSKVVLAFQAEASSTKLFASLVAERTLADERNGSKIIVEVKSLNY